jgi:hypothetical protein
MGAVECYWVPRGIFIGTDVSVEAVGKDVGLASQHETGETESPGKGCAAAAGDYTLMRGPQLVIWGDGSATAVL